MAGLARSGDIYDDDLSPELLSKALKNTVKLFRDNTEVDGGDDLLSTPID
jgi:hypothetical protein